MGDLYDAGIHAGAVIREGIRQSPVKIPSAERRVYSTPVAPPTGKPSAGMSGAKEARGVSSCALQPRPPEYSSSHSEPGSGNGVTGTSLRRSSLHVDWDRPTGPCTLIALIGVTASGDFSSTKEVRTCLQTLTERLTASSASRHFQKNPCCLTVVLPQQHRKFIPVVPFCLR